MKQKEINKIMKKLDNKVKDIRKNCMEIWEELYYLNEELTKFAQTGCRNYGKEMSNMQM